MSLPELPEEPAVALHKAADLSAFQLWRLIVRTSTSYTQPLYKRATIIALTNITHGSVMLVCGLFGVLVMPILAMLSFLVFTPFVSIKRAIDIRRFINDSPELVAQSRRAHEQQETNEG